MSLNIENKNKYSIDKAVLYATKENIISQQDVENLKVSLQKIYDSEFYLSKIKNDLALIFCDFTISFNDIPIIINLILDSIDTIKLLIITKKQISHSILKYVVFGILYRIIIDDENISEYENKILQNYEHIWKIIMFSPSMLFDKQKEASCFCFL